MFDDTIIAMSSPPAAGGLRAIVRLSGPHAWEITRGVCDAPAAVGFHDPVAIGFGKGGAVRGAVMFFKAPKSFTGEDIAELHLPNSPPLVRAVTDALLAGGRGFSARTAEPGEFSARAFFNGKMDLTQAEGIAATISATQRTQLRAAAGLRAGALHRDVERLVERLANLLALVEAGIDFADEEEIHFIDAGRLQGALQTLVADLHGRLTSAIHMDHLAEPPTVVFVGRPNVGKSSLINALAGVGRSIVSPEAGTTRDILAVRMATPAGEVRLLDVPGEEPPTDELRRKMMAARARALLDADLVVEVFAGPEDTGAGTTELSTVPLGGYSSPSMRVTNKSDLYAAPSGVLSVSAKMGDQIDLLRDTIGRWVTGREHAGGERLALNHRHRALMLETQRTLEKAVGLAAGDTALRHPELLAAELRAALDQLGQITGTVSPDEVLGRIFSQFCIGK